MLIAATALQHFVATIFEAAGCSTEESNRIADYLVRANLTGHDSHGVIRVPRYVQWLQNGHLFPGRRIEVLQENHSMAVVNGPGSNGPISPITNVSDIAPPTRPEAQRTGSRSGPSGRVTLRP